VKESRRWPTQAFRIASLLGPSAAAWDVARSTPHANELDRAVTFALAPLWLAVATGLLLRTIDAALQRARGARTPSLLERLDVLTSSGCAMAWLGSGAILGSASVGWASLSVIGLMGLVVLYLAVLWTFVRVGGKDPIRSGSITRRFSPAVPVEGDAVREELSLAGARIPAGFRLFATGRVGERWVTSRYTVESSESRGEILLGGDIGPAVRGEHEAEPVAAWLEDVLGLCRSVRTHVEGARLTVLPRTRRVGDVRPLLSRGGHDLEPQAAPRLPTEGSMRLREYAQGDDARRIHWVRSLAAGELVVRLPDELPPDRPSVQLVLDTFFPGADDFACSAPAQLLDAMVAIWLGVGQALVDAGVGVTLVTAAPEGDEVARVQQVMSKRTLDPALRLGARVRWQEARSVVSVLGGGDERSIVVSSRPLWDRLEETAARVIVVPAPGWAPFHFAGAPQFGSVLLPFPSGSEDNRGSRRRRQRRRFYSARRDHETFLKLASGGEPRKGSFVARGARGGTVRLEAQG
jgi:uncharacterized protein (DUF58 family)